MHLPSARLVLVVHALVTYPLSGVNAFWSSFGAKFASWLTCPPPPPSASCQEQGKDAVDILFQAVRIAATVSGRDSVVTHLLAQLAVVYFVTDVSLRPD